MDEVELKKNNNNNNYKRYIVCLVKLSLSQLPAYQCLLLIYLNKTEVTHMSHEYLTNSSISFAKALPQI